MITQSPGFFLWSKRYAVNCSSLFSFLSQIFCALPCLCKAVMPPPNFPPKPAGELPGFVAAKAELMPCTVVQQRYATELCMQ